MYNSGGALLKEAYGSDNIRMKKKDKKKKDLRYFPERGIIFITLLSNCTRPNLVEIMLSPSLYVP